MLTELTEKLLNRFNKAEASDLQIVYCFDLKDKDKKYFLKIDNGECEVTEEEPEKVDITLTSKSQVWMDIMSGEMTPQLAFMTGRLNIKGDMPLALKLPALFNL